MVGLGTGCCRLGVYTIFWPPGPLPLTYDSSISDSGGGFGRGGRALARCVDIMVKVRIGDPKGERAVPKRKGRRTVLNIMIIPFRSSLVANLEQLERPIPQQCCRVPLTKSNRGAHLESTLTVGGQGCVCVTQSPVVACATRQATATAACTGPSVRKVTHPTPVPPAGHERQPNFGSVGAVSGGPFPFSFDSIPFLLDFIFSTLKASIQPILTWTTN